MCFELSGVPTSPTIGVRHAPRRPWRPSVEGEAKSVLGPGGELPTEGASVPLGDCTRWCEEAERIGRAKPIQRLATGVRMYGHRTVRFHDDESDGSRQVRVESPE